MPLLTVGTTPNLPQPSPGSDTSDVTGLPATAGSQHPDRAGPFLTSPTLAGGDTWSKGGCTGGPASVTAMNNDGPIAVFSGLTAPR